VWAVVYSQGEVSLRASWFAIPMVLNVLGSGTVAIHDVCNVPRRSTRNDNRPVVRRRSQGGVTANCAVGNLSPEKRDAGFGLTLPR